MIATRLFNQLHASWLKMLSALPGKKLCIIFSRAFHNSNYASFDRKKAAPIPWKAESFSQLPGNSEILTRKYFQMEAQHRHDTNTHLHLPNFKCLQITSHHTTHKFNRLKQKMSTMPSFYVSHSLTETQTFNGGYTQAASLRIFLILIGFFWNFGIFIILFCLYVHISNGETHTETSS